MGGLEMWTLIPGPPLAILGQPPCLLGFNSETLTSWGGQHLLLQHALTPRWCLWRPLLTFPVSPFLSQGDYVWPGL